jgi:hypothetical protein
MREIPSARNPLKIVVTVLDVVASSRLLVHLPHPAWVSDAEKPALLNMETLLSR